jgi:hypothetical protein
MMRKNATRKAPARKETGADQFTTIKKRLEQYEKEKIQV